MNTPVVEVIQSFSVGDFEQLIVEEGERFYVDQVIVDESYTSGKKYVIRSMCEHNGPYWFEADSGLFKSVEEE